MEIPFFSIQPQHKQIRAEALKKITEIYDSGQLSAGKEVEKFENDFAAYCDQKYCVLVDSGTAALWITYRYHNQSYPAKFVFPANSFVASASPTRFLKQVYNGM